MKQTLKSKLLIVLTIVTLFTVSLFACACQATLTLTTFTAGESFGSVHAETFGEFSATVNPEDLDDGTEFYDFSRLSMRFGAMSEIIGSEVGAIQFDIIADRDVEGYFSVTNLSGNGSALVIKEKLPFSLKANRSATVMINCDENFFPNWNGSLVFRIETALDEESAEWKEWAQTKYSISDFVFALNE